MGQAETIYARVGGTNLSDRYPDHVRDYVINEMAYPRIGEFPTIHLDN